MQTKTVIEQQVVGFGKRLRAARQAAGLSQLMLAERADVDLAAVSFLERAKRAPNLNTLVRVARAAEVPPASLLTDRRAGTARTARGHRADGARARTAKGAGAGARRRARGRTTRTGTVDALRRFGANLRTARHAAAMSQEELAASANIDRAAISIIERGGRSANLRTIIKLADALDMQPAQLLDDVE